MKKLFFSVITIVCLLANNVNAQTLFVKEVKFSGTDAQQCKLPNWVKVMSDTELFEDNFQTFKNNEKAIFADSIVFIRYGWDYTILGYMHSEKTKLPLKFGATQIGVTWEFLFDAIKGSFSYIRETVGHQENAAVKGDKNYNAIH